MLKKIKPSFSILYILFFAITIIYMLIRPQISIEAISDTLLLFSFTVLPSLFPFILCTQVLIMLNGAKVIGFPLRIITRLMGFDDTASGAYAASLVGGYPVGASSLNLLYNQNMLRGNYLSLMLLCSNCGPMYVLATVGIIMLGSYKIGVIIFAAHIFGALITSLIANTIDSDNNIGNNNKAKQQNQLPVTRDIFDILERAIMNTARIMAKIFGLLCFFRLISDVILSFKVIPDENLYIQVLVRGLLEMVDGCVNAAKLPTIYAACLICFIISFGGLSAVFQSISVSKELPYNRKLFLAGKLIHGFLSSAICYILLHIIPITISASSFNQRVYNNFFNSPGRSGTLIIIGVCLIYLIAKPRLSKWR